VRVDKRFPRRSEELISTGVVEVVANEGAYKVVGGGANKNGPSPKLFGEGRW
jgi:hypothetical protein